MRDKLLQILEKGVEQGFRPDYIRRVLLDKGYDKKEIEAAFSLYVHGKHSTPVDPLPEDVVPRHTHSTHMNSASQPRSQEYHSSLFSGSSSSTHTYLLYALGGLCALLFITVLVLVNKPAEIQIVEKIVEVPVALATGEGSEDLRTQLDNYGALSLQIDEKDKEIEDKMLLVTGLSLSIEEKDTLLKKQEKELQELHDLIRKERKEVVALLVQVLNHILGQTERVSS